MSRACRLLSLALVATAGLPALAADAGGDWWLMARHGECHAPDAALRRRFADLPPVDSPETLVAALQRRGETVRVGREAGMVTIEIPAREMSLLLVRRESCREFASGPR